jgi:hypothetical protein
MAIIPIVPLHFMVLSAVDDISPVVCHQVVSVGAVFASVPFVIVVMVSVVYSDTNLLSFRFYKGRCSNRGNSSNQEY